MTLPSGRCIRARCRALEPASRRREGAPASPSARNIDQIAARCAFKLSLISATALRTSCAATHRATAPLIDHRRTLHAALARIRHRRLGNLPRTLRLKLTPNARGLAITLLLISMLGGESLMLLRTSSMDCGCFESRSIAAICAAQPAQSCSPALTIADAADSMLQILFRITLISG